MNRLARLASTIDHFGLTHLAWLEDNSTMNKTVGSC